ncbi:MAG: CoA-binding protein [Bacteroidota bacterium]|nr:CoA-binding protein [Bacteroidota bacterium]
MSLPEIEVRENIKDSLREFFSSPAYAVVGVSRSRKKIGNTIFRAMKERGLRVHGVHLSRCEIEGERMLASVLDLDEAVHSVVTAVPPGVTSRVVEECAERGIGNIWMQPGSESDEAIRAATAHGIHVIYGECIILFLEPVRSFHAVHKWINRIAGVYPEW